MFFNQVSHRFHFLTRQSNDPRYKCYKTKIHAWNFFLFSLKATLTFFYFD